MMEEGKQSVYKPPHRKKNRFWRPGNALAGEDLALLGEVQKVYESQGYAPTKREVASASELKQRFRVWDDVLLAAGIPSLKDPEEKRKRTEAKEKGRKDA